MMALTPFFRMKAMASFSSFVKHHGAEDSQNGDMKNDIENPPKKTVKTVDGMVGWGQIDNRPSRTD